MLNNLKTRTIDFMDINFLNSLKAVSLGVITILILGLVNQLALIMAAVGYNSLINLYPAFSPWTQVFTYTLGGLGFFVVMSSSGLVTAMASNKTPYANAILAAVIGSSLSLYLSLKDEIFTPLALFFLVLGIGFAAIGCWFWMRNTLKNSH